MMTGELMAEVEDRAEAEDEEEMEEEVTVREEGLREHGGPP